MIDYGVLECNSIHGNVKHVNMYKVYELNELWLLTCIYKNST